MVYNGWMARKGELIGVMEYWARAEAMPGDFMGSPCMYLPNAPEQNGYVHIHSNGRRRKAHRVLYEAFRGEIPDGMTIDHLCRERACVNPWHMEPVTGKVNILRSDGAAAINRRKTQCIHGHAFDAANTYIRSDGKRFCRECNKIRERRVRSDRRNQTW